MTPELSRSALLAMGPLNGCDEEPIAHPGSVQPHGFLLGVDPATSQVSVCSDNVALFTTASPQPILGAPLSAVVGAAAAATAMTLVGLRQFNDVNPQSVTLPAPGGMPGQTTYEMVVHRSCGLLVLEFTPRLNAESDLAAVQASIGRTVRRPQNGASDDSGGGIEQLCDAAVKELRRLSGYDRVMAYRFAADASGEVVAEACRPHHERYLGLHYPAGDIPRQARVLYFKNRLRLIADIDYAPVPLRCLPSAPGAAELDLGQCLLRSVSPVHLRYLRNMGVAATMTISLVVDDRLWGMLACHHDSPKVLSYYVRLASELIGSQLALRIRDFEARQEHERRDRFRSHSVRVVTAMAAGEYLARGAASVASALLGMADADGAVLEVNGDRVVAGQVPGPAVLDRLLATLGRRAGSAALVTDSLATLLREAPPGAQDEAGLDPGPDAAGAIYLSLDHRSTDCVLWLRADQSRTLRWAGAPQVADGEDGGTRLTPRASFAEWLQTVRGHSRAWLPAEITIAEEFAEAMPELMLLRAQNRLVQLALHDSLTGLANRTLLLDRLGALATRASPVAVIYVAVLFVDLDGFKAVNDTFGHAAGDTLLTDVAHRLKTAVRPGDTVARLGGDEFVVLLDNLAHPDEAAIVAQRILRSLRVAFPLAPEIRPSLTASIGLAYARAPFDAVELLRQSDNALYSAKRAGRDRLAVFNKTPSELQARAAQTVQELRAAVAGRQLVVFYQPILSASASWTSQPGPEQWLGVEALVRWQHPERGLLGPDHFIPLAEESALIVEVGEYVLVETLRQLAAWQGRLPNLYAAVNVSARELAGSGYAAGVLSHLAAAGVPAHNLRIEVTETQIMEQPARVAASLASLVDAGVGIAIDDFGTGFASLLYVRDLPARNLKIDRSFVSGLPDNPRDLALVSSAIKLAHELGMTSTAEGVETADQMACLQALGCDLVQGYLFSRPIPATQIDSMLAVAAGRRP